MTTEKRFQRRLVGGSRAAPPEDCGGVYGIWNLVEKFETGAGPWGLEPDEQPGWIDSWKPDQFDLAAAKGRIRRVSEAVVRCARYTTAAGTTPRAHRAVLLAHVRRRT